MPADLAFLGIRELFTGRPGGLVEDAAVVFSGGRVVFVGPTGEAPRARRVVDARGLVGMPGLVDCHTHACFAGSRATEFEARLAGATYTSILEAGGGIHATVRAVRAASQAELEANLALRLDGMLEHGVTTVEVKSGYGLDPESEEKMLRAMAGARTPVEVVPTFLGAHAVPAEYGGRREAYVDQVIHQQLPRCAPLSRHVDVYCDRGAFTLEETRAVLEAGIRLGLRPRVHAEQVAWTGAAALAAQLGASSADHLERLDAVGVEAMARHRTVAVLLPGAMLYLHDSPPPVASLRRAGVPLAVATDFNPGTSPVRDLWATATLACLTMGLTVEEVLLGITRHAALALGRPDLGWVGEGSAADLALFATPPGEPAEVRVLVQYLGGHRAVHVVKGGRQVVGEATGTSRPSAHGAGRRPAPRVR